jgi:hypothetical protein
MIDTFLLVRRFISKDRSKLGHAFVILMRYTAIKNKDRVRYDAAGNSTASFGIIFEIFIKPVSNNFKMYSEFHCLTATHVLTFIDHITLLTKFK